MFDLFKKLTTLSCASFSRTFDKKNNSTMGLKAVVDDGTGTFLRALILDFFQADGKIPFNDEALSSLVRWEAIVGSAFTTMLGGMP